MQTTTASLPALTMLSEDEMAFQQAIREFAEAEIRPHVMAADEA